MTNLEIFINKVKAKPGYNTESGIYLTGIETSDLIQALEELNSGSGVPLKWPLADGTAGQVMKTDGAGTLALATAIIGVGNIPFTEYIFAGGIFDDLASGTTDIYTCPAGKKAFICDPAILYNNTAGSVSTYSAVKISGSYHRIGLAVAQGANSGGNVSFNQSFLINAGESYAIVTGGTGQSVQLNIIEFPDTTPISRIGAFPLVSGDNTLYTCPANKKAFNNFYTTAGRETGVGLRTVNLSGGSITVTPYAIRSGESKAAKFQSSAGQAVANNAVGFTPAFNQINEGDFVLVNTSSAAAGQNIWGLVIEVDE